MHGFDPPLLVRRAEDRRRLRRDLVLLGPVAAVALAALAVAATIPQPAPALRCATYEGR